MQLEEEEEEEETGPEEPLRRWWPPAAVVLVDAGSAPDSAEQSEERLVEVEVEVDHHDPDSDLAVLESAAVAALQLMPALRHR